jgi:hypothetical protein
MTRMLQQPDHVLAHKHACAIIDLQHSFGPFDSVTVSGRWDAELGWSSWVVAIAAGELREPMITSYRVSPSMATDPPVAFHAVLGESAMAYVLPRLPGF